MSDIKRFGGAHPDAMTDSITGGQVQKWIETLLRSEKPVSPTTVKRYLSGIRSYWDWMQDNDHISKDHKPFSDRTIKGSKTKAEKREDERDRWEPHELVALWQAAEQKGDLVLTTMFSRIRDPARFGGRDIFWLDIQDNGAPEQSFVSFERPDVFDAAGQPIKLSAELSAGSMVKVDTSGAVMRAVQIVKAVFANPFAEL